MKSRSQWSSSMHRQDRKCDRGVLDQGSIPCIELCFTTLEISVITPGARKAPEITEGTLTFSDMAYDVYSFGTVIYECLTGAVSLASLKRDAQVIRQVTQSGAWPNTKSKQ